MGGGAVRRTAYGALVSDWGRILSRVYTAGLAGDGRRTRTACLEAIAVWLSGWPGRHRQPAVGQPALQPHHHRGRGRRLRASRAPQAAEQRAHGAIQGRYALPRLGLLLAQLTTSVRSQSLVWPPLRSTIGRGISG